MNDDLQATFATARRLADLQERQPLPLRIHRADRPRDGADRHPESFRGIERATGQIRPSQTILRFDYHSKGLKP